MHCKTFGGGSSCVILSHFPSRAASYGSDGADWMETVQRDCLALPALPEPISRLHGGHMTMATLSVSRVSSQAQQAQAGPAGQLTFKMGPRQIKLIMALTERSLLLLLYFLGLL